MWSSSKMICQRWSQLVSRTSVCLWKQGLLAVATPALEHIRRPLFWEPSMKGRRENEHGRLEFQAMTFEDQIKEGFQEMKKECVTWKEEWKEKIRSDPKMYEDGDVEVLYKFDNQKTIDLWDTACDRDWEEGFSNCTFQRSKAGHALFSGFLDSTRMPKDGRVNRTGWANASGPEARRSFYRNASYDWTLFTHLVMRVRGDGRNYAIILRTHGMMDVTWFDIYSYGLYTHGGPYWQYCKIPFSRFFYMAKGRLQDQQVDIPLTKVKSLGFTLMDTKTGPFSLEIDYIGLCFDPSHTEEFAYEMYYTPEYKYINPSG